MIPGPTVLTVVSYSLSHGKQAAIPVIAGATLGNILALTVSLLGLGVVLSTSAFWFTLVKWAGGGYLLYLGINLFLSGVSPLREGAGIGPGSPRQIFFNTFMVTALNPKGIIFFVAFLPQFVNPADDATVQLWVLASTFVIAGLLGTVVYTVFAVYIGRILASTQARQGFTIAGGSLLCAAGVWDCCRSSQDEQPARPKAPETGHGMWLA